MNDDVKRSSRSHPDLIQKLFGTLSPAEHSGELSKLPLRLLAHVLQLFPEYSLVHFCATLHHEDADVVAVAALVLNNDNNTSRLL